MISKNHVKHIQQLHSKKYREENALFIIEGIKIVTEFLNSSRYKINEVLALPEFISVHKNLLIQNNILFTEINEEELKKNKCSTISQPSFSHRSITNTQCQSY